MGTSALLENHCFRYHLYVFENNVFLYYVKICLVLIKGLYFIYVL